MGWFNRFKPVQRATPVNNAPRSYNNKSIAELEQIAKTLMQNLQKVGAAGARHPNNNKSMFTSAAKHAARVQQFEKIAKNYVTVKNILYRKQVAEQKNINQLIYAAKTYNRKLRELRRNWYGKAIPIPNTRPLNNLKRKYPQNKKVINARPLWVSSGKYQYSY